MACVIPVTDKQGLTLDYVHVTSGPCMPLQEEKRPSENKSHLEPEVRATVEATQKVLEDSAAEIERSKRLLRETEELGKGETPEQATDTSTRKER
jgi:hypothetical protein